MPITSTFTAGVQQDSVPSQPWAQFRNLLDGADFSINPMQRNIAGLATNNAITTPITNTVTYFADRWFAVAGASSAVIMTLASSNSVTGFNSALQVGRNNGNNNNAVINFGQVLETQDAYRAQGQQVTFSFWAAAGANFTSANNTLTVQVISGTGTNQTANNMVGNNWTGQTNVINSNQALTTTMTRYSFTGPVASNATQLGVLLSYTPSNANATTTDYFQVNGLQLEIGGQASQFEHRDIQVETEMCQRYTWVINEPASGVIVGAGGTTAAANNQTFYLATPVQMRTAPTLSVSAGLFKVTAGGAAANATNFAAGTTHTPNAISITSTLTQAANGAALLQGGGGNGYIVASAEF